MYIGIDLGTSAVKLLLADNAGKVIKTVSKEYSLYFPEERWAEQNPEDWWDETLKGLKEVIKGYEKDIKAISFSGQMHGLVTLDAENKVIRPAILWCDQRTEKECEYLNKEIGQEIISKYTGNFALTGFTAPKILWMKNNEPENFKRIKKILLPKDYLAFKLCGNYSIDTSDASGTLLLDVKNRRWSKEMLEIVGIKEEQLPKLYESFEVVGILEKDIAIELGLNSAVKIVAGGGDQAVGAIGVGVVGEGKISVALGTSGVVFASSTEYVVDKENRLHSFCHGNGKYHQMGVMLSAAGALKWWVEGINKTKNYDSFVEKECQESRAKGLYFLPYLMGERTPHNAPNAKGAFIGIDIQHTTGDMTRAVLEGITFGLKDSLELLKEMKIPISSVRVSGGGSKSKCWKQLIADAFNTKVETVNSTEGPAYGAVILAMVGDGIYKSVNEACKKIICPVESYFPNKDEVERLETKYKKFRTLYPLLKKTFIEQ
ncbi:MAG: xylulokinase [Fusobacteriaceae bacterium]